MIKYLRISSYVRKQPFLIDDFATAPLLNFLKNKENFIFFIISADAIFKVAESNRKASLFTAKNSAVVMIYACHNP
jgi:hypothetical protein